MENSEFIANNSWMMLATALVFIMHLGFASVEAGFAQAKNTVNILFKNTLTQVIGIITYAFIGFHRSEEHTSALQSLMRISYSVFCLKQKNKLNTQYITA